MIDLHAHTTASDGSLTPSELVQLASQVGLRAVAVTDHDTVDGLPEALEAGLRNGVEVIPGIELAVDFKPGQFHMLGYFIAPNSQQLTGRLHGLKENRARRNALMVQRMRELQLPISMEDILAESGGGVIGRPHMAKALVRKGVVPTVREAFRQFLGEGAAAHVPKDKIGIEEGIRLIHSAGGLAAAAHPISLRLESAEYPAAFRRFRELGLDGVECYYSQHTPEQALFFLECAAESGLIPTAGSDFHGDAKPDVKLGQVAGGAPAPYRVLEQLKRARARLHGVSGL